MLIATILINFCHKYTHRLHINIQFKFSGICQLSKLGVRNVMLFEIHEFSERL